MKEYIRESHQNLSYKKLSQSPLTIFKSLEKKVADQFSEHFNIRTVEDMANFNYAIWASQLVAMRDLDKETIALSGITDRLKASYANRDIEYILDAPPSAFEGLSQGQSNFLKKELKIESVEDLAYLIYYKWSQDIVHRSLAEMEEESKVKQQKDASKSLFSGWSMIFGSLLLIFFVFAGTTYLFREKIAYYIKQIQNSTENSPIPKDTDNHQNQKNPFQQYEPAGEDSQDILRKDPSQDKINSPKQEGVNSRQNSIPNDRFKNSKKSGNPPIQDTREKKSHQTVEKDPAETIDDKEQRFTLHRVRKGESLVLLSKRYYGNYENWQRIYQANRDQLNNPSMLRPGMNIKIPPQRH